MSILWRVLLAVLGLWQGMAADSLEGATTLVDPDIAGCGMDPNG